MLRERSLQALGGGPGRARATRGGNGGGHASILGGMALRVGVIGGGFGADVHVPGLRAEGHEVVAIATARPDRAEALARQLGIPSFTTDALALARRADIDLVAVVSPPTLHHDHVLAAIAAGKHVLCEKPFAASIAEARAMLEAAERAGIVHAVDHEFRYAAARSAVKERIVAGTIGEVRLVHVVTASGGTLSADEPRAAWWLRADRRGGLLGARASHWIDTLRWWLGDVARARGELRAFVPERATLEGDRLRVTSDDTCEVLLRFASGALATIALSNTVAAAVNRVEVHGSTGALRIDGAGRLVHAPLGAPEVELLPAPGEGEQLAAYRALVRRVTARVAGDQAAEYPTFRDGLAVQEVLEAVYADAL